MGTEHRTCGIFYIRLGIITHRLYGCLAIMTLPVSAKAKTQASKALCIAYKLSIIVFHEGHGGFSRHKAFPVRKGLHLKAPRHPLYIRHCPSDIFGGQLYPVFIIGLKEHIFSIHEALTYGSVSGLPEVSSLCVLIMGLSCHKTYAHIRKA